ncbi:hypothetical protein T4D_11106 [Trichinella pseudospiralis]|uniref:Uncharacterized protein n=1 Tax=Trichinella pseudospiralis TaxID=6337 RepID=A0A0V1FEG7_TRIPS|nr:hypothetical protein T4D_11106 [Trichinella pseudospiralis]
MDLHVCYLSNHLIRFFNQTIVNSQYYDWTFKRLPPQTVSSTSSDLLSILINTCHGSECGLTVEPRTIRLVSLHLYRKEQIRQYTEKVAEEKNTDAVNNAFQMLGNHFAVLFNEVYFN